MVSPTPRLRSRIILALALTAALLASVPAAAQQTPSGQQRLVTIAARSCPSYEDITANRARNNIMESLKDLGPDTPYGENGLPFVVDPAVEARVQPNCTAIANWQFTLGRGISTRDAIPPEPWGRLSFVTGPFSPTIVTANSVPLLDSVGQPTGGTISGATTIALTGEQRELAAQASKLWIQGGTKADPITDAETYGFGALRCATDNLNGDNVEWISYPPDAIHVFCFAYYVKPAPTSGSITVRKEVELPQGFAPQKIRFTGNISYDNGEFFLTAGNNAPAAKTFIRAGGSSWNFTEEIPPLGRLDAIDCTTTQGSAIEKSTATGRTSVALRPGDDVVCTYRNSFRRPPSGLTLRKISYGGTGRFGFDVEGADAAVADAFAETLTPGLAELVQPRDAIADLPSGTYTVTETLPPDKGGRWELERVACEQTGAKGARNGPAVEIDVRDAGTVCTFYNRFTPAGRITLRKLTLGGTATARFQVRPNAGDPRPEREQLATTTEPGVAVTATGDDLDDLPIGTYTVKETISGPDRWEIAAIDCNGRPYPSVKGQFEIELTDAEPALDCTVANRRIDDVTPPTPLPPEPPTPPGPPDEVGPEGGVAGGGAEPMAELRITKRATPRRVRVGASIRYLITVTNRGPDTARNVTVSEPGDPAVQRSLALRPSKGTCRERPPRYCSLGTLAPGKTATIRVRVKTLRTGRFVNRVAVNTSTRQRTERGKRARARVRVGAGRPPRFTG